jgi:hypothetical protein
MTIFSQHRLAAGGRIAASLGLALGAVGSVSCYTAGANPAASAGYVSREVMPIDRNATSFENLYDAIRHLRPEYLRVREQGQRSIRAVAFLDGVRLGDPTMLRLIPADQAVEVRWLRPSRSSPFYRAGDELGGGIFVRTK